MSRMVAFAAAGWAMRLAGAALMAALTTAAPAAAAAPRSAVVLQLDGPAQFEFAGYFAALWKGFYDAAGLTVEIRLGTAPGTAPIDPAHEVADGHAQFGVGTMQLVVDGAQGLPLLLLAPIFQSSGTAIYYRAGGDFASPGALLKARVGRFAATDILDIELTSALRSAGIDPARLRPVPLAPGQTVTALANRAVDVASGSAWDVPWLARARNLALGSFDPAAYRVAFYGDTLFTLAGFAQDHPAIVRRFRDASLRGWAYALDHPAEIAARLVAELPPPPGIADPAGFARYQIAVAQQLSRFPAVPLGHSSLARWNRIEAALAADRALVRTADADSFVYDPASGAQEAGGWRGGAIAAAVLAVIALGTAAVWRRRRRLRAAPPSEPAPAPAAPPPRRETRDLNALLTALEPGLRARVPPAIDFRLSLFAELWPCRTNGEAVAALVSELVAAASTALKPEDTLVVGTRNAVFDKGSAAETPGAQIGEFARITVRDSGPGLPEAVMERIYDDPAAAPLAVTAAREAMERLGGFARVESAEGVGTAVHLYFARTGGGAATAGKPARPGRYKTSGSSPTQRRSRSLK